MLFRLHIGNRILHCLGIKSVSTNSWWVCKLKTFDYCCTLSFTKSLITASTGISSGFNATNPMNHLTKQVSLLHCTCEEKNSHANVSGFMAKYHPITQANTSDKETADWSKQTSVLEECRYCADSVAQWEARFTIVSMHKYIRFEVFLPQFSWNK